MSSHTPDSSNFRTWARSKGLGLFIAAFLLYSLVLTPDLWTGGDDARNILAAKSYLAGYGVRLIPDTNTPAYLTDHSYVLTLAFLYNLTGDNYLTLKLFLLVFSGAGSVWLFYALCRLWSLPQRTTMSALCLFLTSPLVLAYVDILIPEIVFLFVSMLFCFAIEKYLHGRRFQARYLLLGIATGFYLHGLGNASLTFLVGGCAAILLRRFHFSALTTCVAMVGAGVLYFFQNLGSFLYFLRQSYSFFHFVYNFFAYALKYLPAQIFPPFRDLSLRFMDERWLLYAGYLCGAMVTVTILLGLWPRLLRRSTVVGISFLVMFGVIVYWHVIEGGRFLFPFLPYITLAFITGLFRLCQKRKQFIAWSIIGFLLACNLFMFGTAVRAAQTGSVNPDYHSYDQAIHWLAARDSGSIIAARKPHPALWGHELFQLTLLDSAAAIQQHSEVEYIIADTFREWAKTELRQQIAAAGTYHAVYQTVAPVVIVYQRNRQPSPSAD